MRVIRRSVKDESGAALSLALVMIVLISVMGAGLLAFVSRDFNAVVEVNQGQKAFEMADAGVQAARQQLAGGVSDTTKYDGTGTVGAGTESQWSWQTNGAANGVTLNNLDGLNSTADDVNVTIQHRSATDDYEVISTGEYGDAKRKVEAIFALTAGAGGTPAFYTQSDIKIKERVTIKGVSLFSERNITIEDFDIKENSFADFKASYEGNNTISKDVLNIDNTEPDWLGDWNKPPWNTVGRKGTVPYSLPYNSSGQPAFTGVGFAAEGRICGSSSCDQDKFSVADGVYGYDRTTGTKGNNLKFVDKSPDDAPNAAGTITYPFKRTVPDPVRLKELAQNFPGGSKYHVGSSPPWNALFNEASKETPKVVFIDAQGSGVPFKDVPEANAFGILVVWCGKVTQEVPFKGIIISLHGEELPGGTKCGADKGGFINKGQKLSGYVYAEGNTGGKDGIELEKDSEINPYTGPGMNELLGYAFGEGAGSSSVEIQAWRELYE